MDIQYLKKKIMDISAKHLKGSANPVIMSRIEKTIDEGIDYSRDIEKCFKRISIIIALFINENLAESLNKEILDFYRDYLNTHKDNSGYNKPPKL